MRVLRKLAISQRAGKKKLLLGEECAEQQLKLDRCRQPEPPKQYGSRDYFYFLFVIPR